MYTSAQTFIDTFSNLLYICVYWHSLGAISEIVLLFTHLATPSGHCFHFSCHKLTCALLYVSVFVLFCMCICVCVLALFAMFVPHCHTNLQQVLALIITLCYNNNACIQSSIKVQHTNNGICRSLHPSVCVCVSLFLFLLFLLAASIAAAVPCSRLTCSVACTPVFAFYKIRSKFKCDKNRQHKLLKIEWTYAVKKRVLRNGKPNGAARRLGSSSANILIPRIYHMYVIIHIYVCAPLKLCKSLISAFSFCNYSLMVLPVYVTAASNSSSCK